MLLSASGRSSTSPKTWSVFCFLAAARLAARFRSPVAFFLGAGAAVVSAVPTAADDAAFALEEGTDEAGVVVAAMDLGGLDEEEADVLGTGWLEGAEGMFEAIPGNDIACPC